MKFFEWKDSERLILPAAVIIFSYPSLGLLLMERNLEELDFVDEEFLHKKINSKDFYVDYGATEDIPEDACN